MHIPENGERWWWEVVANTTPGAGLEKIGGSAGSLLGERKHYMDWSYLVGPSSVRTRFCCAGYKISSTAPPFPCSLSSL